MARGDDESGRPEPSGEGWVFRSTMREGAARSGRAIEVELLGNAYDLDRHWLLEREESSLTIDLGEAREVLPVFVEAPEGVRFEYCQGVDTARLSVTEHEGPTAVRETHSRRAVSVTWMVEAEGYVPMVGTESDWTIEDQGERRVLKLNASFDGWGAAVRTVQAGSAEDGRGGTLPFTICAPSSRWPAWSCSTPPTDVRSASPTSGASP